MAEPTLQAAYNDLAGDVGHFLGYGRGPAFENPVWTDDQQDDIDRCVKGGLRKVYNCGYEWSFLRPTRTLALASGATTAPMPDDFGGLEGPFTITTIGSTIWPAIELTNEARIREAQANFPTQTGRPYMAALKSLEGTTGVSGQRWQLIVFPTTDAAYTLSYQCFINPDYLTGATPYPYGSAQHAETFLEACLSVAERIKDDTAAVHAQAFAECLETSKAVDRRNKPAHFGYNGDRSDERHVRHTRVHWNSSVLVDGNQY